MKKALDILVKGRERRDPLGIIEEWRRLAENILSMLRDEHTKAFLVTIPEALGVNQTRRVKRELDDYEIKVSAVIVNYLVPEEEAERSEFNRKRREMQLRYLKEIESLFSDELRIIVLHLLPFEVKGLKAIGEVERRLCPS